MVIKGNHLKTHAPEASSKVSRSRWLVNLSLYCQSLCPGEDSLLLSTDLYITFLMRMSWDENISPSPRQKPTILHKQSSVGAWFMVWVFFVLHWQKNMPLLRGTLLSLSTALTQVINIVFYRKQSPSKCEKSAPLTDVRKSSVTKP